jgi:hypothetical protein
MSSGSMRIMGLAVVLALVASALALEFYSEDGGSVQSSTLDGANNAPLPVTSLGNVTTIDQATQMIGVSFSSPTFTPATTTLSQVREREGMAALIYDNPSLPNLSTYSSGKIIVLVMKDNTSYVDPSIYASVQTHTTVIVQNGSTRTVTATDTPLSPSYQLVTVSGHSGWAFSPTTLSNGLH